jgi:hypothetical protein
MGMNKVRRIGAILAATVAAAGMTSMAVASPASAAPQGPRPVSDWLHAVPAHTSTWVNIYWSTDRPVCDAKIRVDGGRHVDVSYPGNRSYTSFSRDTSLRPGRTDYSAVRVNPDFDRKGVALLRTTITYTSCGWHARTMRSSSTVTLPVLRGNNNDHHGGNNGGGDNGGNNGGNNGGDHHGGGDNGSGDHHSGGDNGSGDSGGNDSGDHHHGGGHAA